MNKYSAQKWKDNMGNETWNVVVNDGYHEQWFCGCGNTAFPISEHKADTLVDLLNFMSEGGMKKMIEIIDAKKW